MPKYLVERNLPGAGALTPAQLKEISQKSNSVIAGMKGRVQWVQSYVTGDKIFCVYIAPDEAAIREHATCGGFPCDKIHAIRGGIDPTTGGA